MYTLSYREYENLFKGQYQSLCLFANKYLVNLDTAKDIVQEVFIKVWENKISFHRESNVKSYLYTSVRNKCLDYLKSKDHHITSDITEDILKNMEGETFFSREVLISETSLLLEEAINTLPNKCANIIRLAINDLSNAEVAKELNISIHTVKAQKQIAYKRLRPLLKDYFIIIAFIFGNSHH